jgi:hypothetical protein
VRLRIPRILDPEARAAIADKLPGNQESRSNESADRERPALENAIEGIRGAREVTTAHNLQNLLPRPQSGRSNSIDHKSRPKDAP